MTRPTLRLALSGALMLLAQTLPQLAHAQYSWIDDKGTRVFSDRPPPPGTPASRILKAPRRNDAEPAPAPANPGAGVAPADALKEPKEPKSPPTLADREADYRKRQAKRDADEKKAQAEAAHKAQQQQRCQDLAQDEAQLASGIRISQMSAGGERSFMADDERARRLARVRQALAQCRS